MMSSLSLRAGAVLVAAGALTTAALPALADPAPAGTAAAPVTDWSSRPEARIPFASQVRGFQVKREDNDDVLYLEEAGNRWYRAPLNCLGIGDPRSAFALRTITPTGSVDRFSRIILSGLGGNDRSDCRIDSLVALSDSEEISLGLERAPRVRGQAASPLTPVHAP